MIGKDESVSSREGLSSTKVGRTIMKEALFKSKGYRLFNKYKEQTEKQMPSFQDRFVHDLLEAIKSDGKPARTQEEFATEMGAPKLALESSMIESTKNKLLNPKTLSDRVSRILDSNFVKMTFPVFNALFDAANPQDTSLKQDVVEGHILAIDLSEPMDRIVDQDEDLEFLDDYKLINPYILELARKKISEGGDDLVKKFEDGFRDARAGQYMDEKLKSDPHGITESQMDYSYKKYRAVMGTAGRNMSLSDARLGEAFYIGMSHAAEAVGCGNEMEDSLRNGYVKIPSWPLYYASISGSVEIGFASTLKKSNTYLEEARISLDVIPQNLEHMEFLKFLFLTVEHYTQFWYNKLAKNNAWSGLRMPP